VFAPIPLKAHLSLPSSLTMNPRRFLSIFWIAVSISIAQTAPGQTNTPSPLLEILPAVELVFQTEPGHRYKLHRSSDLANWEQIEGAFEGTGNPIRRFQSATPGHRMFYRLESSRIIPLPLRFWEIGGLNFEFDAGPLELTFLNADRYRFRAGLQNPSEEQGAITAANQFENSLSFFASPLKPTNASFHGAVRLDFTSPAAGSIMLTHPDGSTTSGLFRYFNNQMPIVVGNDLSGKHLQLSYPSGGSETFEFVTPTTLLYENGYQTGNYTYTSTTDGEGRTTGKLNIRLRNGWDYEIILAQGGATVLFRSSVEGGIDPAKYVFY
jgi:hypothetical protein